MKELGQQLVIPHIKRRRFTITLYFLCSSFYSDLSARLVIENQSFLAWLPLLAHHPKAEGANSALARVISKHQKCAKNAMHTSHKSGNKLE